MIEPSMTKRIKIALDSQGKGTLECVGLGTFSCLGKANAPYKTDVTVTGKIDVDKFPVRRSIEYNVDLNWVTVMDGNKGYWIHEGDITRRSSAGCVNLASEDAKTVYDWIDGTTRITITAPWLERLRNLPSELETNLNRRVVTVNEEVNAYRNWLTRELDDPSIGSPERFIREKITIVAEGDSWFNYIIGKDVVWWLRRRFGYEVHEIAYPGATLNHMAYGPDSAVIGDLDSTNVTQLAETLFTIESRTPRIIMISGGGNDIAGPAFVQLLKHAESPASGANLKVIEGLLDSYEEAFEVILSAIEGVLDRLQLRCEVILHGYDLPFPNGKGAGLGPLNLVGPWFDESFSTRGYPDDDLARRRDILNLVFTMFNERLIAVASRRERVHFLDLRSTLTQESQWANELHPTNHGFKLIAERFDALIMRLTSQDG
jgi:hypothetical protein